MSNRVKFTPEQKMFFVLKFRELKMSLAEFCRLYNVERTAIHRWSIKYDNKGLEGLKEIKKPTKYSSHTNSCCRRLFNWKLLYVTNC